MFSLCKRLAALSGILAVAACSGAPGLSTPAVSTGRVVQAGSHVYRYGDVMQPRTHSPGWISPEAATTPILYAASYDGGYINIYAAAGNNQQPIGQLTSGLVSPQGVAVDHFHRLWTANTNAFDIVGFKRGSTTPFKTLQDPGYYPVAVAVDSHDTVFAANVQGTSGQAGNVREWKAGSVTPTRTLTFGNFNVVEGIGIDANDNVYVTYIPKAGPPAMVEFPFGSKTAQPVLIQDASLGDITFDSSGNLVMESSENGLGVWAPPYTGSPVRVITAAIGNEPTFNSTESKVCVAYANSTTPQITCYNYKTGNLVDTITAGWTSTAIPYGNAFDPPAPL